MQTLKRGFILAACLALLASEGRAQGSGMPPVYNPSIPGYDDMAVTPRAPAGFSESSSTTPGLAPSVDDLTVLEGMINRILELQRDAMAVITRIISAAYPSDRATAQRELATLNGAIEGMLASSTWGEAVARVSALEDPQTTRNFRYLKIYGPDGHLDVIARQQERIREVLGTAGPGTPPAPAKGETVGPPPPGNAVPPEPGGTLPPAPAAEEPIVAVQKRIDEISLKIAEEGLTKERRQELEIERNALVQRMAELARQAPGSTGPATSPDGHQSAPGAGAPGTTATGATASTATSTTGAPAGQTTAPPGGAPTGPASMPAVQVPLVPNSYGVSPMVLSDAQIRAILDGLIAKELPIENAKLSQKGIQINTYRQLIGKNKKTTIISVGKPDGDHYREWLKASGTIKAALDARALAVHAERARAIAAALPLPAPPAPTPPAPTPPVQNPQAQAGGATAPESSALPQGSTLPNGKLDLPSSSAR